MLIPFGVLSAAAFAPVAEDAYELIESSILGSSQSSITFSSLATYASTYKHLQIRLAARSDRSGTAGEGILLRINGDTGSNYARHVMNGNGSTVDSFGVANDTSLQVGNIFSAADGANQFGGVVVDFLDVYSTSKNKTIKSLAGSAPSFIFLRSGVRLNTEAISSLTLQPAFGTNFVTGSRFSLYGIRG
jgi:hypothetical protein